MHSTYPTITHETDAVRSAQGAAPAGPLTFDAFRAANVARCLKWHPQGIDSWSPSDWLTAVTGELGELASLLKMRNRERDGLPGNKFSPTQKQIADELADVLTYLDLLAEVLGVDLGIAAAEKFNEVSVRVGFPDRIELKPGEYATDAEAEENHRHLQALRAGHDTRWTAMLKRRVAVEQLMLDAANCKRPMPTPQELREWALRLGTPAAPAGGKEHGDA